MERIVFTVMALVLVLLAIWFAFRQSHVLRKLREEPNLSPEDQKYYRRTVWRRWLGCGLLIVMAVMIAGLFGMGIFDELDRLRDKGAIAKEQNLKLEPQEEDFLRFGINYVMVLLLMLVLTLAVAVVDIMAIRRYGMRHRRRLREDRQAMLERQLPQLYHERRLRQRGALPPEEGTNPESPQD
jgi:hypothetical protein